ncbi:MAG: T9SS type A sorting domain-containing protein [Calditrichaeota bacterium]|nr:T9SS type A sorting domain-containing protein [Calditrichota bacterium]
MRNLSIGKLIITSMFLAFLLNVKSLTAQDLTLPTYVISIDQQWLDRLNLYPKSNRTFPARFISENTELSCTVRYRGGASRNLPKKSWKIYLDGSIGGHSVLNLNAEYSDLSQSRNHLCLALADIVGLPSPEAFYVSLIVNGEYYGVFQFIEDINRDFFRRRNLGDGDILKPESHSARFSPPTNYKKLSRIYSAKDSKPIALDTLGAKISLLRYANSTNDGGLFESMFDTDNLCKYFALEYVISNSDGFTKNYYLHLRPDGKYILVPWDCDATLGNNWQGIYFGGERTVEYIFMEQQALFGWLISSPDRQEEVLNYINEMITTGFDSLALISEILHDHIAHDVYLDTAKRASNDQFTAEFQRIRSFLTSRAEHLRDLDRFHYVPVEYTNLEPAYMESLEDYVHCEVIPGDSVYELLIHVVDSNGETVSFPLNDNGEGGDENSNDGLYSCDFNLADFTPPFLYCYWIGISEHEGYPYPLSGWVYAQTTPLSLPMILCDVNRPLEGCVEFEKLVVEQNSETFVITVKNVSEAQVNLSGCTLQLGNSPRRMLVPVLEDLSRETEVYFTNHVDIAEQLLGDVDISGKFYFFPELDDTLIIKDASGLILAQMIINEIDHVDDVTGRVVINEINYNSPDNFPSGDWIELFPFRSLVDVSSWELKDENDAHIYVFPAETILEDYELLIVARSPDDFMRQHNNIENVIGGFDFGFGGSGDAVRLFDQNGNLIDWVQYSDDNPWPEDADGEGSTLELIHPTLNNYGAASWRASLQLYGSPGEVNTVFGVEEPPNRYPDNFGIIGAYPNPFNSTITLNFGLSIADWVSITVYDIRGRKVDELFEGMRSIGQHTCIWNATAFVSGTYIVHLATQKDVRVSKIMLLK